MDNFVFQTACVLSTLYVVSLLFRAWVARTRFSHIPTVGPSGMLSSYFGAFMFLSNGKDMIQQGYEMYPGAAFKIPTMTRWVIVVSGHDKVEEIRRAKEDQLSFTHAASEMVQADYTLGPNIMSDPYHVGTIRSQLTRNISARFPDVQDEVVEAFATHIPQTKEWSSVVVVPTIMKITSQTSNRLFVDLPLCRNADFRSLNIQFTIDVMKTSFLINMFPNFLKPTAARIFSNLPAHVKNGMRLLRPIIQEHLENEERYGKDWPGKPNNLISWLLETAEGYQRSVEDLTLRILTVNFTAIHSTSIAFSQVLFDLAANPSYVPSLREEVETVIREEGLTRESLQKMHKLDSFIKESQRLGGMSALSMNRDVIQDFRFADGTLIPKGSFLAVSQFSTHHDEANYSEPDKFDGYRFLRMSDELEGLNTHKMVSLSHNYLIFGNGRPACPGRFFAVNELMAFLSHVLLTYDVAFENNGPRPRDLWRAYQSYPDPAASVMFRKRQV